jgi:hypothetical protein
MLSLAVLAESVKIEGGTLKTLLGDYGDYVVEKRAKDLLQSLRQSLLSLAHGSGTWRRNARGVSGSLLSLLLPLLRLWSADDWERELDFLWH